MTDVELASKVAFLRQPDAYPDHTREVSAIETHMSWVFLTAAHAYKLKKPVRLDGVDFGTPDRRLHNCQEELRLNRRLAPDVYQDIVALTVEADGTLGLAGGGHVVDWLVRMRRLPAGAMLDAVITSGRTSGAEASIRRAARQLAGFYRAATPVVISGPAHRARLADGVRQDLRELSTPGFDLSHDRIDALAQSQLACIERCARLFHQRVAEGRIVEGHGDLRPEHISVGPTPAIIDCLEFSRDLRLLDPADELAFLELECERLGDVRPGRWFLETYHAVTGDHPPAPILGFYRVYRAMRRATIAARHLEDPSVRDPARFAAMARRYLEMVEPLAADRACEGS